MPDALTDKTHREDTHKKEVPPPPRKRVFALVAGLLVILLVIGFAGHWMQGHRAAATHQQMTEEAPTVRTQRVKHLDAPIDIRLPGQTLAFDTATMYARATGYITERRVDIGSRVHKGDLLLRIDAPDLDQQLEQARAQLLQMQAALQQAIAQKSLAHANDRRTSTLVVEGWASRQQGDTDRTTFNTQTAGVGVAQANLAAQQAQVNRLIKLTGFEQVTAPFDGVVTARNVDDGDLVTADQSGGTPLFTVDRDDMIRVQAYVPQSEAGGIHEGLDADIAVPDLDGRSAHGKVTRSSVSLTQNARTLLVEVDVPNPDGALRAGLYADMTFHIPRAHPGIVVPDEALVFDQTGLHVLAVQPDSTVKAMPVTIDRDFGTSAQLRAGLNGDEELVLDPAADLANGNKVRVDRSSTAGNKG